MFELTCSDKELWMRLFFWIFISFLWNFLWLQSFELGIWKKVLGFLVKKINCSILSELSLLWCLLFFSKNSEGGPIYNRFLFFVLPFSIYDSEMAPLLCCSCFRNVLIIVCFSLSSSSLPFWFGSTLQQKHFQARVFAWSLKLGHKFWFLLEAIPQKLFPNAKFCKRKNSAKA